MFARDKQSILFSLLVSDEEKRFVWVTPDLQGWLIIIKKTLDPRPPGYKNIKKFTALIYEFS
jgi:hypothetical protein